MKTKRKRLLYFLALLTITAFVACSKKHDEPVTTGIQLPLTTAAGDCLGGDLTVTGTNPVRPTITMNNVQCGDELDSILLQPGDYDVEMLNPTCVPGPTSTPPGATYDECVFNDPDADRTSNGPIQTSVVLNELTDSSLPFTMFFVNAAPAPVVTGVGAVDFNPDASTDEDLLCGGVQQGEECEDGVSACYSIDGATAQCYPLCGGMLPACAMGSTCTNVAELPWTNPDQVGQIGQDIPLSSIPDICVPDAGGAGGMGGMGGMAGAGGSSGSAGASGTAGAGGVAGSGAGGTAGAGGSSAGMAGSSSGTSGSSGSGGASAGSSGSGGSGGSAGAVTRNFHFVAPDAPIDYPGGAIVVMAGVKVGSGPNDVDSWSTLCTDTDASGTVFDCDITYPPGTELVFSIDMPLAGAPGGFIYWNDMNWRTPSGPSCTSGCTCSVWGGDGAPLGTLTIEGVLITSASMQGNPLFADPDPASHCESGEGNTYNGHYVF